METKKRNKCRDEKVDLIGQKKTKQEIAIEIQSEFEEEYKKIDEEFQPKIRAKQEAINKLKEKKQELDEFSANRLMIVNERDTWFNQVEEQSAAHEATIKAIEQEIIDSTDELRKQMLMQIRQVRMKNSISKEDQLQGTTKLTVVQNT